MTTTLGLVTIGQAPRVDLIPDVADALTGVDFVEHGALDFLDTAEIAELFPEPGITPLVSRLRNGDSAVMGHHSVLPLVNDAIERCVLDGADAVLLLCTGHFNGVNARVPLFMAESLSHLGAAAIVGDDILGVMTPLKTQVQEAGVRWQALLGRPVFGSAADPYEGPEQTIVAAGQQLANNGVQWIVLDCMGYTENMRRAITAATGIPTLLVRSLAVRLAVEAAHARANIKS